MQERNFDLIEKYNTLSQIEELTQDSSFFEVIGRTYDEYLISRMLAYVLKHNITILEELINSISQNQKVTLYKIISVICEKNMNGKRADIFVEVIGDNDEIFTLTIENKIFSKEHDNQTQIYYNYVSKNYCHCKNFFVYLVPVWNLHTCCCSHFNQLTYFDIAKLIKNTNDLKCLDLKNHIEKYFFKEYEMTDLDLFALKNFEDIKKLSAVADNVFSLVTNFIQEDIYKALKEKYCDLIPEPLGTSYRLYKNEWYHNDTIKEKKYYFYIEIHIVEGNPNHIRVKSTFKRYGNKGASRLTRYCDNKNISGRWERNYFVHKEKEFYTNNQFLSVEWKNQLKQFVFEEMEIAREETDKIYSDFSLYIEELNE